MIYAMGGNHGSKNATVLAAATYYVYKRTMPREID